VQYTQGCTIAGNSKAEFGQACKLATVADATVMVMGLDQSQESEGNDRTIVSFPGVQADFIANTASCANGKPVVLVMMNGGPVDISAQAANSQISAIFWVGYPGQSGGQAVAEAVFGVFSPAGRLPYTIYPANYVNQVSMFDMGMRPNAKTGNPGRSYRFYQNAPVYPFGFGLSYTTFTYALVSNPTLSFTVAEIQSKINSKSPLFGMSVRVTNAGSVASETSVLSYVVPPNAGTDGNPIKSLFDYQKVFLTPNQAVTVVLNALAKNIAIMDAAGNFQVVRGTFKAIVENAQVTVNVV